MSSLPTTRHHEFIESKLIAAHFRPGTEESEVFGIADRLNLKPSLQAFREGESEIFDLGLKAARERDVWLFEPPEKEEVDAAAVLDGLLGDPSCEWAGPLVVDEEKAREGDRLAYLTHEMVVEICPPADVREVLRHAEDLGYEILRVVPYGRYRTYHLRAKKHPGYKLLEHCEELMSTSGVIAEPNLAGAAVPDNSPGAAVPGNSPGAVDIPDIDLWDREVVCAPEAREILATERADLKDLTLAVVDGSFVDDTAPDPEKAFEDYAWYDLRLYKSSFDSAGAPSDLFAASAPGHGLRAAGVAAAKIQGKVGVAAGCRVRAVVYPVTEVDVLDMYVWLAGLDSGSRRTNFPMKLDRPADVVTTSVGFGFAKGLPPSFLAKHAFDRIALEGRGGKGTPLFFSAGNEDADATQERPWATAEPNFGIAASTPYLRNGEWKMKRAPYSNHDGVELCAPSSGERSQGKQWVIRSVGNQSFGGTSAATPLAAGVAVLILAARPELRHDSVRRILRETATKIDPGPRTWRGDYSDAYGYGQVNAHASVQEALKFFQPPLAPATASGQKTLAADVDDLLFEFRRLLHTTLKNRCRPDDDPDEVPPPPLERKDRSGFTSTTLTDAGAYTQSGQALSTELESDVTKAQLYKKRSTGTLDCYRTLKLNSSTQDHLLVVNPQSQALDVGEYQLVIFHSDEKKDETYNFTISA